MNGLFGIPVIASPLCERTVPVRKHDKRRQSAAYHRRIQKKWTKRFGTKIERVAYIIGSQAFSMIGSPHSPRETLVVHPEHLHMLRGKP